MIREGFIVEEYYYYIFIKVVEVRDDNIFVMGMDFFRKSIDYYCWGDIKYDFNYLIKVIFMVMGFLVLLMVFLSVFFGFKLVNSCFFGVVEGFVCFFIGFLLWWIGVVLIVVFVVKFDVFLILGFKSIFLKGGFEGVFDVFWYFVFFVVMLVFVYIWEFVVVVVYNVRDEFGKFYVLIVRVKGIFEWVIYWRYVFKNVFIVFSLFIV